jgi:hypothetical protein
MMAKVVAMAQKPILPALDEKLESPDAPEKRGAKREKYERF